MLVSFAVENWTCFRDRQEFSMEIAGRVSDEFAFDTGSTRYPRLNRVAAIYGPNGSGKSCFVRAISFMQNAVLESARSGQAGGRIHVIPFRLDVSALERPTSFDIAFIQDEVVYEYEISVDSTRVWSEQLAVRPPGGRLQRWLSRSFDPVTEQYDWSFGPSLRGSREVWRKATRSNALYVSTAVQLNSISLRPIVEWFQKLVVVWPEGLSPHFTSASIESDENFCSRVAEFLKRADIPVSHVRVREEELDLKEIAEHVPPAVLEDLRKSEDRKIQIPEFGLPVAGSNDLAYLELGEQSDGTQRVFSFASPWFDVMEHSRVVVVDELDRSLHPHLVRYLVGLINRASPAQAQLVATVHDVTLLQETLDRNQVWLIEQGPDHAAFLTALSDYHPRKNESLVRGYLGGRYGAIPNVAEMDLFD